MLQRSSVARHTAIALTCEIWAARSRLIGETMVTMFLCYFFLFLWAPMLCTWGERGIRVLVSGPATDKSKQRIWYLKGPTFFRCFLTVLRREVLLGHWFLFQIGEKSTCRWHVASTSPTFPSKHSYSIILVTNQHVADTLPASHRHSLLSTHLIRFYCCMHLWPLPVPKSAVVSDLIECEGVFYLYWGPT